MNLTTMRTETGIITKDEVGSISKDKDGNTKPSRVGETYFEKVIIMKYDDET